jgi:2-oxoglutarate dehydrogenase E2 component (dihydrolipoamide succinyltransferase)
MATEIKMPQLGETVVEGTITKWLKKEGDTVETDELLVEISTDKVDSEVPSSASGTLQKILVQEGETVQVGTPLAVIGEAGEEVGTEQPAEEQPQAEEPAKQEEPAEQEQPQAESEGAAAKAQPTEEQEEGGEAERKPAAEDQPTEAAEQPPSREKEQQAPPAAKQETAPAQPPRPGERGRPGDTSKRGIISPLVRRLADEHSIDLNEVEGTGTGGRIRKQDVLRFVEERKARPAARSTTAAEPAPEPQKERAPEERAAEEEERPAAVGAREELVPWTNIRRRTAEHMVASSREVARAWNAVEADWTNIADLRARAKDRFKETEGFSLTYMPFLAKAVCETLLEMPEVNATFDEENQANLIKRYVNLGIAVALEGGGLIVPVVKGADEKNLTGLARGINDVATRARTKKLSPDDLTQGTFTITNPGPFGSIISVPIIPRGQTAILGFEAIQKRVVVVDDEAIAIRHMGN